MTRIKNKLKSFMRNFRKLVLKLIKQMLIAINSMTEIGIIMNSIFDIQALETIKNKIRTIKTSIKLFLTK